MDKFKYLAVVAFVAIISPSTAEYSLFDCPAGWEDFGEYCYKFVQYPVGARHVASSECQKDGAFVLSVHTEEEHLFILGLLDSKHDQGPKKRDWWTSGRRESTPSGNHTSKFYWEGDGVKIETFFAWQNDSIPAQTDKDYIIYNYDSVYKWGWILGKGDEKNSFICKISKDDIYKISEKERGPDYGVANPDASTIERGPKFAIQPTDIVYEKPANPNIGTNFVTIECMADAYPEATYEWYKERGSEKIKLDPLVDTRYTFINGRLVIDKPTDTSEDDGFYQCAAANKFGKILSNKMSLGFGYLQDFPKSPRSPVTATSYQSVSIECNPPPHFPDILTMWFKNDPSNFVRPDLKPYLFISQDGRLYFSEVTQDDVGNYYCVVNKPGVTFTSGVTSMPTELRVQAGSPGTYEPVIENGFPYITPQNPLVGDNLRIECFAKGSFSVPLVYDWERVELLPNDKVRVLPLPDRASVSDHNRVLTIQDVQLYDAGHYRCRVRRPYGGSASEIRQINLNAIPYFILELKDAFVDVGDELMWRCEASGIPSIEYSWLKNGEGFNQSSIAPEDQDRITISNNVVTIKELNAAKDDAMYQCAAKNLYGIRYSTAQLKVLSFAPTFEKYPLQANQFATVEGSTTIFCRPEAAPRPTITWYKNGAGLNPGTSEGDRVRQMPNGNLYISSVQYGDAGIYKCHAANEHGEDESIGNLTVLATVTISMAPEAKPTIPVNKTRFLHCVASYDPQLDITYTWKHGSYIIEFQKVLRLGENKYQLWQHEHFKRGSRHNLGGLYIMNADYEQAGRYTCTVETPAGDRFTRYADVQIIGPPSEPVGVFLGSNATAEAVTIKWKQGGENGRQIKSFVIEAKNSREGFWRIMETNVMVEKDITETMTYRLSGLRPFSQYQVRMRAENELGTSKPCTPSEEFTTEAVKPDKYPMYVGGGGGKVGDLVVTWKALEPWEENGNDMQYWVYSKPVEDPTKPPDNIWRDVPPIILKGRHDRYVYLVGEKNFYRQYDVAVQAVNEKGNGPISPAARIFSAMALPSAIATNVRTQPYNSTACLVHWEEVEDKVEIMKGKLSGYKMSYWPESFGSDYENAPRVTLHGQQSEGLVIGLEPDSIYYFAVYVWNEAGNGPKSQYFIQRTLRRAPMNQPVEVKVFRKTDRSIRATWRGVSTTQLEEPLNGYKVRVWREGTDIKHAKDYNAGKNVELYIDDLQPHILYKLRIFGWSRGGQGVMSSPAIKFQLGAGSHTRASVLLLAITFLITTLYSPL